MAARPGDPARFGRVAANEAVLARIAEGATRAADGVTAWSPDGWTMRTHPDLTEALEQARANDGWIVRGITVLADDADRIYAVGWGTGGVWLRIPSGPAFDDAVAGEAAEVEGLPGWALVDAWRVDLASWLGASASLTAELVPGGA